MTVQDKYVSAALASGKIEMAALANGARIVQMVQTEEIAATPTDEILSVYRFFKGLNGNLIPTKIEVFGDTAIVALVADVGLYEQGVGGLVVDSDAFGSALNIAGITTATIALDGMGAVDIANRRKKIYEHAGHTVKTSKDGYDICLTATTAATTGGTVTIVATFIVGS